MKQIATAFALLLFLATPLALSGCTADSLAGPDAYSAPSNGEGKGKGSVNNGGSQNGGSTNPDRDILD